MRSGRALRCIVVGLGLVAAAAAVPTTGASAKEPAFDAVDAAYAVANYVVGVPPDGGDGGVGPLGVATDPTGAHELYVGDWSGDLWRFPTAGGSPPYTASDPAASPGADYVGNSADPFYAFTFDSLGHLYATSGAGGLVEIDKTDAHVVRRIAAEVGNCLGLGVFADELYAECGVVYRIGNLHGPGDAIIVGGTFFSDSGGDGLTIAPDGTLYVATGSGVREIQGPSSPTAGTWVDLEADDGSGTATAGFSPGSDGIAVGLSGSNRFLIINNTTGSLQRLDFGTGGEVNRVTTIASGGTRGDFASVGTDGCMYLTQSITVAKLTKADGSCDFAPTVPTAGVAISGDLAFGAVPVDTSATKTVTVTNTGTAVLAFSEAAKMLPVANGFTISGGTCTTGAPVAPATSCTVDVTFAPMATVTSAADLVLTDNAPPGTQTTSATGVGTAIPGTDVAEVPFATLLPLSLLGVAATAVVVRRRRPEGRGPVG